MPLCVAGCTQCRQHRRNRCSGCWKSLALPSCFPMRSEEITAPSGELHCRLGTVEGYSRVLTAIALDGRATIRPRLLRLPMTDLRVVACRPQLRTSRNTHAMGDSARTSLALER